MPQHSASASVRSSNPTLANRIEARFGLVPNFFRLQPETPEITELLWGFTEAAYLDNPLPSLFKERLFVYLSRFCAVRYCIARHVGFLVGLGRPSADASVYPQSIAEALDLLRRSFPRGKQLHAHLSFCSDRPAPITEIPSDGSQIDQAVFAFAAHVFAQTSDAPACLAAVERLLGPVRLQYFLLLLAFIRAAHYWTSVHPDIEIEDDIKQLLATHEALAEGIRSSSESAVDSVSQSLLDELPALRLKADKAVGLLAAIVDNSDDAIVSKDLDGTITSWNKGAERLFGYTAHQAIGQHIMLIVPSDRRREQAEILDRLGKGDWAQHLETVRVRKDGSTVDVSLTISPVKDPSGRVVGFSKIARDITERKHGEAARREMSARLLHAQDNERRRLARDLHDGVGTYVSGLSLSLGKIRGFLDDADPKQQAAIAECKKMVQAVGEEIRTVSYLLHPPDLEDFGLKLAMDGLVRGFSRRSGIRVSLDIADGLGRFKPDLELALFRVAQEALNNVYRHSESKVAKVRLFRDSGSLVLEIADDGKGFEPDSVESTSTLSVGISGMRERVQDMGGTFTIEPANHRGCVVRAKMSQD
jgi:PAS domain S-box-containing protein